MFMFIKNKFDGLLTSIVNASNHTKYLSLSNRKCTTPLALINLHPNQYSQGLCYYPFVVSSDRSVGSCNTLNDLSIEYVFQTKQKIQI